MAVHVNKYFGRGFGAVKPEKSDLIFNRGWTQINGDKIKTERHEFFTNWNFNS